MPACRCLHSADALVYSCLHNGIRRRFRIRSVRFRLAALVGVRGLTFATRDPLLAKFAAKVRGWRYDARRRPDVRVLLIGPPGSGKGTQGERLAQRLGVEHIAAGDLLRAEVAAQTELGRKLAGPLE